jgi:hypothetical protein
MFTRAMKEGFCAASGGLFSFQHELEYSGDAAEDGGRGQLSRRDGCQCRCLPVELALKSVSGLGPSPMAALLQSGVKKWSRQVVAGNLNAGTHFTIKIFVPIRLLILKIPRAPPRRIIESFRLARFFRRPSAFLSRTLAH